MLQLAVHSVANLQPLWVIKNYLLLFQRHQYLWDVGMDIFSLLMFIKNDTIVQVVQIAECNQQK